MITININYSADSNTMRIDDISKTRIAGTIGDDNATHLNFHFDDADGILDGFGVRVEFDVIVDDDPPYKPYMILDESMSIKIPNAIMSRVRFGSLPIQLAFSRIDSENSDDVVFYSLNKLVLSVADAIMSSATEPIDIERHPDLMDAIYSVRYDDTTSSFYFTQFDGSQIKVHLSDLSEEHFEVENESQLILLNNAEDGDTATTLDNGKWYKLYGLYSDINNWKLMSSFRYGYSLVNELSKIVLKDVEGIPLSEVPIDDTPTDESPNLISSDAVYQSISTERSERQSADATLQSNIDTEIANRTSADTTLQDNIDSEATARSNADTTLQNNINTVQSNLTQEIADRKSADTTISTNLSNHINDKTNPHGVTKAQVGLANVDNTSDADKPISTATQNALNLKADKTEISSLYRPKGSVATYNDLPSTAQIGDVYDVQSTGMNYVWTGSKWDELGAIIDLSPYYTKTEVDGALDGKVSKSGDTMTGTLVSKTNDSIPFTIIDDRIPEGTYPIATVQNYITLRDKGNGSRAEVVLGSRSDDNHAMMRVFRQNTSEFVDLQLKYNGSTDKFEATAPHPSSSTENNNQIATTLWINSADIICRTVGNQTISGDKTFNNLLQTGNFAIYGNDSTGRLPIVFRPFGPADQKNVGLLIDSDTGYQSLYMTATKENPFIKIGSGNVKAYATTTPQDASEDEIATANWSLGKFVNVDGDVMTGMLHLTGGLLLSTTSDKAVTDVPIFSTIREIDVSSVNSYQVSGSINMHWSGWTYSGGMTNWRDATFTAMDIVSESKAGSQTRLTVWQPNDGNQGWVSYPSWNVGVNDNSDKILTIQMANSLPSLVHSYGNETVAGVKTYSSVPKISTWAQILGVPSSEGWTKIATITKSGSALNRNCALIKVSAPYHRKIGLLNIWAFGSSVFTDCGADWVYNFGYTPNEVAVHLDTSGTVSVWMYQDTNRTQTMFKCVEQYGMWGLDLTSWTILDTDSREFATALPTEGTIHYSTSSKVTTPSADATGTEVVNANWVNNKLAGKVTISTSAPTSSDGNDGDIWIQY